MDYWMLNSCESLLYGMQLYIPSSDLYFVELEGQGQDIVLAVNNM